MTVDRTSSLLAVFLFFCAGAPAQEPPPDAQKPPTPQTAPKSDNYAGTVVDFGPDKITVAKTKEQRTFRITPETKIEGKLKSKVRVTVRFYASTAEDGGYTATRIIVRTAVPKPK
jgi:hypothetical protein